MNRLASLDTAFDPASVAIAGVGPETTGKCFLESLLDSGFKGKIYPLHPRGGEISGLKIYRNVKDIPEPVDYVISCVPARLVPQLIKDCAEKGAKVMSLFTAGFSENGTEEGRQLEAEICHLAEAGGLRLIGPNCMGVYSPKAGLSFVSDFPRESGGVALVCQSGGNTIYFVRLAAERGVRFSKVISYGNASDVDESDLFEYLAHDAETEIVAAYIEGIKDGGRFYQVLSELSAEKPVVVLKGGYTQAGARTAASHTGALAGSNEVFDSLLQQTGALRVYTLEELVDTVVTFLFLPLPKGRRVAMVGGGGGASVLATDACAANGFLLPPIPPLLEDQMRRFVNGQVGLILNNPIELNMSDEASYNMASTWLANDAADLLLGNCVFGQQPWPLFEAWYDNFCDTLLKVHADVDKPMGVVIQTDLPSEEQHFLALQQRYVEAGLPVYHSMSGACQAIDRFLRYHKKRSLPQRKVAETA